jgi:hypothetical protein
VRRWPFVLFALPWIYSGAFFGAVALLASSGAVRDPNQAATYWIFGMVIVCVVSVIASLNVERKIIGIARIGLMLLVIVNLIVATGVSAGVGFMLAAGAFGMP